MILINGVKHACLECIRGHRSSTCKHTKRPLVQVRSRGRPTTSCNHRIAVFAEEVLGEKPTIDIKPKVENTQTGSCCLSETPKPLQKANQDLSKRQINDIITGASELTEVPGTGAKSLIKSCCSGKIERPYVESEINGNIISNSSSHAINDIPNSHLEKSPSSDCCSKPNSRSCCGGSTSPVKAEKSKEKSCSAKEKPVIILRASEKQLVDVSNGSVSVIGPYNEQNVDRNGGIRKAKHSKNCSCCKPSSKNGFNNFKITRLTNGNTITTNKNTSGTTNEGKWRFVHFNESGGYDSANSSEKPPVHQSNNGSSQVPKLGEASSTSNICNTSPLLYNIYVTPSCSIPGSCACNDDCNCEGCVVHSKKAVDSSNVQYVGTSYERNDVQNRQSLNSAPSYDTNFFNGTPRQNQAPDVIFSDTETHQYSNITNQIGSQQYELSDAIFSTDLVALQSSGFLFNMERQTNSQNNVNDTSLPDLGMSDYDLSQLQNMFNSLPSDDESGFCICTPEECRCYDCEIHGISQGVRISDGVQVNSGRSSGRSSVELQVQPDSIIMVNDYADDQFDKYDMSHDCVCPYDGCKCFNCAKHGIFNGIQMDHTFLKQ